MSTKYIGMDVHKESISIAVRNAAGKLVMECVIETKAITGQNRSCSIKWAAKQEKLRPLQGCFFLTSPFIELTRT
jgi:hypothetical protein